MNNKWERSKLGNVCKFNPESFNSDDYESETIPYISLSCVSSGKLVDLERINVDEPPSRAQRTVREGDVLIGKVRPKQESHFLVTDKEDGYIASSGFAVLRTSDLKSEYLIQEVLSNDFYQQMEQLASGNSYPSVNISDLKIMEISTPPVSEQERIASVLYSVDDNLEHLHERKSKLTRLKNGLMQTLLTGEKRVNENIQVLDEITKEKAPVRPNKEWNKKQLGDLSSLLTYGDEKPQTEFVEEGTYPVYGANGIIGNSNEFNYSNAVTTITCRGATCGSVHHIEEECWITNNSIISKGNDTEINQRFLSYYLEFTNLEAFTSGSAQSQITLNLIDKVDINLPPLWEQERIASILYTVDEMIEKTDSLIEKYERVKNGLMQDLLSGDVRTPENLEVLEEIMQEDEA